MDWRLEVPFLREWHGQPEPARQVLHPEAQGLEDFLARVFPGEKAFLPAPPEVRAFREGGSPLPLRVQHKWNPGSGV